jgi:hypothetical protein
MKELKETVTSTYNKKQPGPHTVFPEFIKNFGPKTKDRLLLIHNMFWTSKMSLLADWTKTVIIPISKQGKPTKEI